MAMPSFAFGAGFEAKTPQQVARNRAVYEAMVARGGQAPANLGQGLNRVGETIAALAARQQADQGDAAGRDQVAQVLSGFSDGADQTEILGALANPWVAADPSGSAVAQALLQRQFQNDDPAHQLDLDYKRAQIDALKAKPAGPEQFNVLTADEVTQLGLPPGSYQRGSLSGKVDPIGTGSGITINTGDNSGAFGKKADELAATRLGDVVTGGQDAAQFAGDLKTLAALAPQIDTGKTAEIMTALGPYAEAFGVKIDGLPEMQAYQSIIDKLSPQMRPAGSGAASDFDARQFLSSLPSLGRTPEGNQIITQTLAALQQHKMAAAEIAGLAFQPKEQGGITWQEAEKRIRELPDPYDGFNEYKKQADAANTPAKITTEEEYNALPSGALFIDPDDGNTYRKP